MRETSNSLSKQNSQQPKQFRGGEKKVMKKSLSLLVAIAMVFSMFAAVASAAEKQTAGEYLQEIGVIKGNLEGNLNEDKEWKREDLTVLLSRLLGVEKAASEHANTHEFTDVTNSFYDGYISWAKEEKLMEGKGNGKFGYNDPLTNQQFAAVVLRALKVEVEYADVPKVAVESKLVAEDTDFAANALRGVTYDVIVKALNTEVAGTGKKLGTILGLKGFEVTDLKLVSASAVVASEIKLNFNTKVAAIDAKDVVVTDKNGAEVFVEEAKADGETVTVKLAASLVNDGEYTVHVATAKSTEGSEVKDASATFTYKKSTIASVAIKNTTIARGDDVEYIVKDTAGNDITKDFPLSAFEVNSSDPGVVTLALNGQATGKSIVVISVPDSAITTGNVVVTVNEATALVLETLQLKNGNNETVADSTLYTNTTGYKVVAEAKRQNGSDVTGATYSFISRNPSIAVVDTNHTANREATITPVQAGTATIVVTATVDGVTVSKTLVVTVKAEAKAAGLKVDKSTIVLKDNVAPAGLPDTLSVTLIDQYNGTYKGVDNSDVTLTYDKTGADAAANATVLGATLDANNKYTIKKAATNGVAEFVFTGVAKGNFTATVSVTLPSGAKQTQRISVVVSDNAVTNGYIVETTKGVKLDSKQHSESGKHVGELNTVVKVFTKNAAGAKIAEVNAVDVTLNSQKPQDSILEFNDKTVSAKEGKVGKEAVNVAVNNVIVGTLTFEVDYSSKDIINKVQVNKASISIAKNGDLMKALFSTPTSNGAISLIDKYGAIITADAGDNVQILSSNSTIVTNDGNLVTGATGKVVLTIQVEGKIYTVNVNVTN